MNDFTIKDGVLIKYNGDGGDVVIPDDVTKIGSFAFENCDGVTSVKIPEGVTKIGNSAFSGCAGLTSVTTPGSLSVIGDYAFSGCVNLESVHILEPGPEIGEFAFAGTPWGDRTFKNYRYGTPSRRPERTWQAMNDIFSQRGKIMKFNENQKVTLTLNQLKRLIRESDEVDYVYIPLGLTADKNVVKLAKPGIDGNPSPWSILDDLDGQLSDGMWENSPQMEKFWRYFDLEDVNGQLNLKVSTKLQADYYSGRGATRGRYIPNGFLDEYGGLGGDPKKIRDWLANHIKMIAQDDVGKAAWKRDNETQLDYFDSGTTVAMVYAVYDILKGRPGRGKSSYYSLFLK